MALIMSSRFEHLRKMNGPMPTIYYDNVSKF
jgi:hypothetical protein